jgi:predicted MFS family arabinose efflux permease
MMRNGTSPLRPESREGASAIAVLFGVLFLASVDNQLLIPLIPRLGAEFGQPVAALGRLFSVYALAAAVCSLIAGPLSDRFGRVVFLRAGLACFLLTAAATTQVDGYLELLWVRAGTGAVAGTLSLCTAGYVGDSFAYERRGRVMGIVLSSYFAALILGIPLSSWIAETWGWRAVFAGSSGVSGLLLLGSMGLMRRDSRTPSVVTGSIRSFGAVLSRPRTRAALATSFLISGGTLAFLTYISGHLGESFGLSAMRISLIFVVSGAASVVAGPLSGWLSDRWTKRRVFLTANTLLAAPLLLLGVAGGGFLLFGAVFLIGLCVAFRQTALQTLQTELIFLERRGAFLALRNCSSQLGIALSVLLAGRIYTGAGYVGVTIFAALLTLAGSAVLYYRIPEPGGADVRQRRSSPSPARGDPSGGR